MHVLERWFILGSLKSFEFVKRRGKIQKLNNPRFNDLFFLVKTKMQNKVQDCYSKKAGRKNVEHT